jgi:outer membrane protein TolC
LEAALAEGGAANRSLRQSAAAEDRAAAQAAMARAALMPSVSFSEAWQRGDSPVLAFTGLLGSRQFAATDFAIDRLNRPGSVSVYGSRVMVSQLLFDGGRTAASASAAARGRDVATTEHDIARNTVALEIVRAYGRVLTADAAVRASATAIAAGEEDLHRSEARRSAGAATDADVLLVSTHLAAVRQRAIAAEGDANVARAQLNRLTGAPIDRAFAAVEPAPASFPSVDLPQLLSEAEANRQEIRRAASAESAARQQLRAARAQWMPAVTMRAGYEGTGIAFSERSGSWIAVADVSWTLSIGGAERARVRASIADVTAAMASRDDAIAAVRVEVVTALRRLESARAQARLGDEAVAAAREAHRIIRNRYDNGLAAASDVLNAAVAALDAETARTRATVDAMVAAAELRHALGRPVGGSQ